MNNWNAGLWLSLMFLCQVTQGGEEEALSMRLSVKEQCFAQLPVVCRVTIKNEGTEKREVYVPSRRAQTLASGVRRVGATAFEGPVWLSRKAYLDRTVVTLMPGQEIEGWIDLWDMLTKGLSVGEYECMVRYSFGSGNNDHIEGWSNKFRVVEPTKKDEKRANERLTEIRDLLGDSGTNSTEQAMKRLEEFARSPEAAVTGYLAQARCLVGNALMQEERWLEYVAQLEKLRQAPPEWRSAEDLVLEVGGAYFRGGYYDKAIAVMSEIAEQNPAAKRVLNNAKVMRDHLRKRAQGVSP